MVKKIFGWVILMLLLSYVVCASIWARGEARKNTCSGIEIEIAETMSTDSMTQKGVMAEINRYPLKILGEQISGIDTKKIENHLKSYAQFENVICNFTTDGRLHVNVIPMVPEIRVFEDSMSYYINKDGKRMQSKANFYVDVPVVSGRFGENFSAKDLLPVIRFLSQEPVLGKLIGMVHGEDPDNIILIPRIHGHVINFGDTNRLAEKSEALLGMYKKVLPYKGWDEYDTISVKFKGQVVATRKKKNTGYRKPESIEEDDMEEATLPALDQI